MKYDFFIITLSSNFDKSRQNYVHLQIVNLLIIYYTLCVTNRKNSKF